MTIHNPHHPGTPASLAIETSLLQHRADVSRAMGSLFVADLAAAAREELGLPTLFEDRMARMRDRHVAAMHRVASSPRIEAMVAEPCDCLPVTCATCHHGVHYDDGLMCPRHEGALTHHYCDNGCPDCGRLREERAA